MYFSQQSRLSLSVVRELVFQTFSLVAQGEASLHRGFRLSCSCWWWGGVDVAFLWYLLRTSFSGYYRVQIDQKDKLQSISYWRCFAQAIFHLLSLVISSLESEVFSAWQSNKKSRLTSSGQGLTLVLCNLLNPPPCQNNAKMKQSSCYLTFTEHSHWDYCHLDVKEPSSDKTGRNFICL